MTFLAGALVDAGDLAQGIAPGIPAYVFKGAAESVLNSITLQNDDTLSWTLLAGVRYEIEFLLAFKGSATSDFKTAWSVPGDTVGGKWALGPAVVGSAGFVARDDTAMRSGFHNVTTPITYTLASTASDTGARETGWVESATGGTLVLQWAQNALDAVTAATVNLNSYLKVTRTS